MMIRTFVLTVGSHFQTRTTSRLSLGLDNLRPGKWYRFDYLTHEKKRVSQVGRFVRMDDEWIWFYCEKIGEVPFEHECIVEQIMLDKP